MRTRVIIALVAVVAAAIAGWAFVLRSDGGGGGNLGWKVQSSPFALTVTRGGKTLVADATGPAGPGSRLSYTLDDGSQHTVTALLDSRAV
ncbi:MAG TPA: hypothetical protein VF327_11880, partial [Gaiellaceae bacterium]